MTCIEKVVKKLKSLAKEFYGKKKPKEVTYVGIHIRRTDYNFYYEKEYGIKPKKSSYYNDAMEYFNEEYENCIFVVASDDIKWAKKHLKKPNNTHIHFSEQNPTFSLMTDQSPIYKPVMDDDISKVESVQDWSFKLRHYIDY